MAAGADKRIGKYGTVHGKAFGGKCLPKDLKALIAFARAYHELVLLESVEAINETMRQEYGNDETPVDATEPEPDHRCGRLGQRD